MPGGIGQKLLNSVKSRVSSDSRVPGTGVIHNDERNISTDPENGTYPRLTRLSDGSILAAFTRHEGNVRILRVSRSTDNGRTFDHWGAVDRGARDVDNMYLLEVPSASKILAAFRNHDRGPEGHTHFRITVCQSTDNGRNWTYLTQVAEKSPPLGIWEPYMRLGRHGEVQLYFSKEFAPDDQRTMLAVSNDAGETWSQPVCKAGEKDRFRDGMTGFTTTKDDGREALFMVFETTRYGPFNLEAVVSYDDGDTWHHRQEIYCPPPGRNAGSPQVASFADGSMVVVFMTDEDAHKVQWTQNADIKAIFSGPLHHGKAYWSKPQLVSHASSFWPSVMAIDDYAALAVYQSDGPRARLITWQPQK